MQRPTDEKDRLLITGHLEPGEQCLWVGKPSPARMATQSGLPFLWGVIWLIVWSLFMAWLFRQLTMSPNIIGSIYAVVAAFFVLPGLFALFSPVWVYLLAKQTVYAVTNRRVIVRNYGSFQVFRYLDTGDLSWVKKIGHSAREADLELRPVGGKKSFYFFGIKDADVAENVLVENLLPTLRERKVLAPIVLSNDDTALDSDAAARKLLVEGEELRWSRLHDTGPLTRYIAVSISLVFAVFGALGSVLFSMIATMNGQEVVIVAQPLVVGLVLSAVLFFVTFFSFKQRKGLLLNVITDQRVIAASVFPYVGDDPSPDKASENVNDISFERIGFVRRINLLGKTAIMFGAPGTSILFYDLANSEEVLNKLPASVRELADAKPPKNLS